MLSAVPSPTKEKSNLCGKSVESQSAKCCRIITEALHMLHLQATIDGEHLACDIGGIVRQEKLHH
jgi:hypothetical protein